MKTANAMVVFLVLCLVDCSITPENRSASPTSTSVSSGGRSDFGSYRVALAIPSPESISPEKIGARLFAMYLDHFKSEAMDSHVRLLDFTIQEVFVIPAFQNCAQKINVESVLTVKYSVLPYRSPGSPYSDWYAGSGSAAEDDWIVDKLAEIGIYKQGDSYSFQLLGVPPCRD